MRLWSFHFRQFSFKWLNCFDRALTPNNKNEDLNLRRDGDIVILPILFQFDSNPLTTDTTFERWVIESVVVPPGLLGHFVSPEEQNIFS